MPYCDLSFRIAVEAADAQIRPRGRGGWGGPDRRERRRVGFRRGGCGGSRRTRACPAPARHLNGAPRLRPIDLILAVYYSGRRRCSDSSFVEKTGFMFWMIIYFRRGAEAQAPRRAAAKTVVVHYTGGAPAAPPARTPPPRPRLPRRS